MSESKKMYKRVSENPINAKVRKAILGAKEVKLLEIVSDKMVKLELPADIIKFAPSLIPKPRNILTLHVAALYANTIRRVLLDEIPVFRYRIDEHTTTDPRISVDFIQINLYNMPISKNVPAKISIMANPDLLYTPITSNEISDVPKNFVLGFITPGKSFSATLTPESGRGLDLKKGGFVCGPHPHYEALTDDESVYKITIKPYIGTGKEYLILGIEDIIRRIDNIILALQNVCEENIYSPVKISTTGNPDLKYVSVSIEGESDTIGQPLMRLYHGLGPTYCAISEAQRDNNKLVLKIGDEDGNEIKKLIKCLNTMLADFKKILSVVS